MKKLYAIVLPFIVISTISLTQQEDDATRGFFIGLVRQEMCKKEIYEKNNICKHVIQTQNKYECIHIKLKKILKIKEALSNASNESKEFFPFFTYLTSLEESSAGLQDSQVPNCLQDTLPALQTIQRLRSKKNLKDVFNEISESHNPDDVLFTLPLLGATIGTQGLAIADLLALANIEPQHEKEFQEFLNKFIQKMNETEFDLPKITSKKNLNLMINKLLSLSLTQPKKQKKRKKRKKKSNTQINVTSITTDEEKEPTTEFETQQSINNNSQTTELSDTSAITAPELQEEYISSLDEQVSTTEPAPIIPNTSNCDPIVFNEPLSSGTGLAQEEEADAHEVNAYETDQHSIDTTDEYGHSALLQPRLTDIVVSIPADENDELKLEKEDKPPTRKTSFINKYGKPITLTLIGLFFLYYYFYFHPPVQALAS